MFTNRYRMQGWYSADTGSRLGAACHVLALRELNLHVIVGDTAWSPPDGDFDFDILAQPGTLQNVQNGFGFIGGGYRVKQPLYPSRKAVEEACFFYDLDPDENQG